MTFGGDGRGYVLMKDRWVQTDMGNAGAVALGMKEAEITVEESVRGLVKVVGTSQLMVLYGVTNNVGID